MTASLYTIAFQSKRVYKEVRETIILVFMVFMVWKKKVMQNRTPITLMCIGQISNIRGIGIGTYTCTTRMFTHLTMV